MRVPHTHTQDFGKKRNHHLRQGTLHKLKLSTYRIGANRTALLIITASRVNLNTKAPKFLNLNNTTAS